MESRSSILRISDAKTLELIELYEEEECLWNSELPAYKNRLQRAAAADRIAKKLAVDKFDGRHVAIKFKNLRNSYCQELKKMAYSTTLGDSTQYKPRVFWFDKMDSFLRPYLQSTWGSETQVKEENQEVHGEPAEELVQLTSPEDVLVGSRNREETKGDRKRPRLSSKDEDTDSHCSASSHPKEDIYDSFGKYVATMLRTMPKRKAMELQPKIVNLLTTANFESDEGHISQSDDTASL